MGIILRCGSCGHESAQHSDLKIMMSPYQNSIGLEFNCQKCKSQQFMSLLNIVTKSISCSCGRTIQHTRGLHDQGYRISCDSCGKEYKTGASETF